MLCQRKTLLFCRKNGAGADDTTVVVVVVVVTVVDVTFNVYIRLCLPINNEIRARTYNGMNWQTVVRDGSLEPILIS